MGLHAVVDDVVVRKVRQEDLRIVAGGDQQSQHFVAGADDEVELDVGEDVFYPGALFRLSILPDAIKLHTMQAIARCKHQNDYREFAPSVMEILTPILELIRARSETPRQPQPGEQIVEYLRCHLSEPSLCLSALAEHFQMSESSVSGLIRSATGESYKAYCDRIRVNRACALLKSGASVQDACEQSGFSSAAIFRRTFKKLMGVPPSEYLAAPDEDGEAEEAQ